MLRVIHAVVVSIPINFIYLFCLNNLDCAKIVVVVRSAYVLQVNRLGSECQTVYRPVPAVDMARVVVVVHKRAIHAVQRIRRLIHGHQSL